MYSVFNLNMLEKFPPQSYLTKPNIDHLGVYPPQMVRIPNRQAAYLQNINNFPSQFIRKKIDFTDCIPECVICCELLIKNLATSATCGHVFHSKCFNNWLKIDKICPICRGSVNIFINLIYEVNLTKFEDLNLNGKVTDNYNIQNINKKHCFRDRDEANYNNEYIMGKNEESSENSYYNEVNSENSSYNEEGRGGIESRGRFSEIRRGGRGSFTRGRGNFRDYILCNNGESDFNGGSIEENDDEYEFRTNRGDRGFRGRGRGGNGFRGRGRGGRGFRGRGRGGRGFRGRGGRGSRIFRGRGGFIESYTQRYDNDIRVNYDEGGFSIDYSERNHRGGLRGMERGVGRMQRRGYPYLENY